MTAAGYASNAGFSRTAILHEKNCELVFRLGFATANMATNEELVLIAILLLEDERTKDRIKN